MVVHEHQEPLKQDYNCPYCGGLISEDGTTCKQCGAVFPFMMVGNKKMVGTYNCPNCGAPITDSICPYCETVIWDFVNVEIGQKTFLRIKRNDGFSVVSVKVKDIKADEAHVMYADDKPYMFVEPTNTFSISFEMVPDGKGIYARTYLRHLLEAANDKA